MTDRNGKTDRTAAERKHRQRLKERAAGYTRVLLKVPTDEVARFKELAAAAVTAREQPGRQQAE